MSFFATTELADTLKGPFPACLEGAPILLPGNGTQLRTMIDQWLDKCRIHPHRVAEFDDSALMKAFGKQGAGIFTAPAVIDDEVTQQYEMKK